MKTLSLPTIGFTVKLINQMVTMIAGTLERSIKIQTKLGTNIVFAIIDIYHENHVKLV